MKLISKGSFNKKKNKIEAKLKNKKMILSKKCFR